jgi:hypothetical protein
VASTAAGNRGHEKPGTAARRECLVAWSLRAGPGNGDGGGTWADNATAERREACLPVAREGSCLASVASRVTARHVSRLDVSGRSANPLARGSAATKEKKGRKRTRRQECAGNEETALFDMVNRKRRGAMHRQDAGAPSRQRQRARVPAERAPRRAFLHEVPVRAREPGPICGRPPACKRWCSERIGSLAIICPAC